MWKRLLSLIKRVYVMEKNYFLPHGKLNIPCVLSAPEFGQVRRLVLGVHGITGSKNDPIQGAIAEEMEMFYSAVLRFDFPLHGDSDAAEEDLNLENCRESLLGAAAHLRELFPEVETLCIFATGFGAYMTLLCMEELQEMGGELRVVLQTPAVLMHMVMLKMKGLTRETFRAMDKVTFRNNLPVSFSFYEEIRRHIVFAAYRVPMLILHSEEDQFIPIEHIRQFHSVNEMSTLVLIPGASHQFEEDGAWDMVLDLTRDWFEFQQVYLSDYE